MNLTPREQGERGYLRLSVELDADGGDSEKALGESLASVPPDSRVQIKISTSSWDLDEEFDSTSEAQRRLQEARALLRAPANVVWLRQHNAIPVGLDANKGNAIDRAYRAIDHNRSVLNGGMIRDLRRVGLWNRTIILGYEETVNTLVFRYIGHGHAERFGYRWVHEAIGHPSDFELDSANSYSRWVAAFYDTVFNQGDPCRHWIDSVIPSHQRGRKAGRVNYDRLLAPIRLVNGTPGLMVVTQVTPGLVPLIPDSLPDHAPARPGPSI